MNETLEGFMRLFSTHMPACIYYTHTLYEKTKEKFKYFSYKWNPERDKQLDKLDKVNERQTIGHSVQHKYN